jgi:hypothetical protein
MKRKGGEGNDGRQRVGKKKYRGRKVESEIFHFTARSYLISVDVK